MPRSVRAFPHGQQPPHLSSVMRRIFRRLGLQSSAFFHKRCSISMQTRNVQAAKQRRTTDLLLYMIRSCRHVRCTAGCRTFTSFIQHCDCLQTCQERCCWGKKWRQVNLDLQLCVVNREQHWDAAETHAANMIMKRLYDLPCNSSGVSPSSEAR